MDLGECVKFHDLALRADYEIASKQQEYFFELDVSMNPLHSYEYVCINCSWMADRVSSGHRAPAVLHRRLWPKNRTGQETAGRNPGWDQRWSGCQGKTWRSALGNPWTFLRNTRFHLHIIFMLKFHTPAFCAQTSDYWVMVHSSDINWLFMNKKEDGPFNVSCSNFLFR